MCDRRCDVAVILSSATNKLMRNKWNEKKNTWKSCQQLQTSSKCVKTRFLAEMFNKWSPCKNKKNWWNIGVFVTRRQIDKIGKMICTEMFEWILPIILLSVPLSMCLQFCSSSSDLSAQWLMPSHRRSAFIHKPSLQRNSCAWHE